MVKVDELKLETYDTEHASITGKLGEIDENRTNADNIMAKNTWQGDAYETCLAVLSEVNKYFGSFSGDYMQLNSNVTALISNVDTFVAKSEAVAKLS